MAGVVRNGPAEPIKYDFGNLSKWNAAATGTKETPSGITSTGGIQDNFTQGTMEGMTNEQILSETERVQQETLKSTQRALQELNGAEQAGTAALDGLARQNEQLDNIVANLDKMRTDIAYSDMVLQKIASPFAFLHLKKETQEFETIFGSAPHWSGPVLKKGNLLTGYNTRYFVLLYSRLMYFSSEKNVYKGDLRNPRGEMNVKGANIDSNRDKLEIIIRNGSQKWSMRCESTNDFAGWVTMLERHAAGQFPSEAKTDTANGGVAENVQGTVDQMKSSLFAPQQQQQVPNQAKTIDEQVDDNLDLMMEKLNTLGGMACEQKQAIEMQNAKLDIISETMEKTDNDMVTLKLKHGKRLKD